MTRFASIAPLVFLALPAVVHSRTATAAETGASGKLTKEKIILGFEETELSQSDEVSRQEKPGRESWFYLLQPPEGFDFAARFEWPIGACMV